MLTETRVTAKATDSVIIALKQRIVNNNLWHLLQTKSDKCLIMPDMGCDLFLNNNPSLVVVDFISSEHFANDSSDSVSEDDSSVKSETITISNSNNNNTNNKKSPQISTAKSRWKALARSAFVRNLTHNKTTVSAAQQTTPNTVTNNHNSDTKHTKNHTNGVVGGSDGGRNGVTNNHTNSVGQNDQKDLSFLELLALNSLELSTPGSDIILKSRHTNWVQLSGHEDSFALAGPGTIWKKRSNDDTEVRAYEALMNDPMSEMVPKFFRDVFYNGDYFIELEDLLFEYKDACIMDIKMGTRTFLEDEVINSKARNDLYEKMVKIDPNAPTQQEHEARAVTKLTYMKFREALSSSSNLGFRIEGFKAGQDLQLCKDLKLVKYRDEVKATLKAFLKSKNQVRLKLIDRLKRLAEKFEDSDFFDTHEVIGSSLLIIHNGNRAGVWMIDFAKTRPVPDGITIDHKSQWHLGNHEDGYLFGLNNLIGILEECSDN